MKIASKPKRAAKVTAAPAELLRNAHLAMEQQLGAIVYRSLDSIVPYADNPRIHPERQIVQLMASISHFSFALPLLVDTDGVLITGHAVYEAARRLELPEVPVIVAEHWSKAQVRAYRLADNQLASAGSWNEELLRVELASIIEIAEVPIEILGWSTGEVDVLLDGASVTESDPVDEIPEAPVHPVSRVGDLWLLGDHRLLCGSSLDPANWVILMDGQIAAMVFCDPPWNVPINGHVSSTGRHTEFAMATGEMTSEEFIAFNETYLSNMNAHLKDGAVVMACMDHSHIAELMAAARSVGLKHLNMCVWKKSNAGMGSLYRSHYELVLILKHGTAPHTNQVELGKHGRYRSNIWEYAGANSFSKTRAQDLADHPTVKPRGLVADAIRDVTRHGEIVLDAFSGSGTTILACETTRRLGYAIEIEPKYVDVAIRRWQEMTGKVARLDTGETYDEVRASRGQSIGTTE